MNNKIFIVILFLFCSIGMLSSCVSSNGDNNIAIGMTYDEVLSLQSDMKYLIHRNYMFYVDSDGKNIVVEFGNETYLVEKIEDFQTVAAEQDSFSSITEGMTVFDVVEKVGLPLRCTTSGLSTLDFQSMDGSMFRILWDENMKVIEVTKVN